uniref:Uncharacterized protein n=1 Tax=Anguilla anguilla TaxID=7936 RepID=A0A0E9SM06_ANGAN
MEMLTGMPNGGSPMVAQTPFHSHRSPSTSFFVVYFLYNVFKTVQLHHLRTVRNCQDPL